MSEEWTGRAGDWLKSPERRRALLSNPKLSVAAIDQVLRYCSKTELTLAGR